MQTPTHAHEWIEKVAAPARAVVRERPLAHVRFYHVRRFWQSVNLDAAGCYAIPHTPLWKFRARIIDNIAAIDSPPARANIISMARHFLACLSNAPSRRDVLTQWWRAGRKVRNWRRRTILPTGPSPTASWSSIVVCSTQNIAAGWSSPVAREAHNLEVTGSNPVPATWVVAQSCTLLADPSNAGFFIRAQFYLRLVRPSALRLLRRFRCAALSSPFTAASKCSSVVIR